MFLNLIPLWKKLFKTKLSHPYVPFVKSVSFALSVSIVLSATSVPLVKSVPSIPSVPIVTSVSLVTSVPSAQNLPIVTSVPSAQNVPLVKSEPSIPSVPIVTSVPSAQNVRPKIKTYADVVSSRVNQNDLSNSYDTKTGNNNRGNNLGSHIHFPKAPNVRGASVISIPTVGAKSDMSSPNVGKKSVRITPNVGEIPVPKAPYDGGNVDSKSKVNTSQVPNMGNSIKSNLSQSSLDNNRVSSKYLASFNIFLKRKNDLELEVNNLLASAENDQTQPSTLKLRGNDLKTKLASLKIDKWIEDDRLGYFDPIELCNWEDRVGRDIASVLYKSEDLINLRKGLAQSGIKKREPPKFSGSVLDYPLFKKNWSIEVSPGGLPELIEINHLKDSVPVTAKDRLYEVETMTEAWNILDRVYGKEFDLRNRLKQEFLSIKLSAKFSPLIEIELFQKVHKIAARIKAAKAQSLLENDFEYISLVYQLLPETQRERWVNHASLKPTWDSFYTFLEDVYEKALLKKQINDSYKPSVVKDRTPCTKCNRIGHSADNCFAKNKVLVSTLGTGNCPVCKGTLHDWTNKSNETYKAKRLSVCPKIKEADENTKNKL